MVKNPSRKSIALANETVERLNKVKHKGQSYDGILTEILDLYLKDHQEAPKPSDPTSSTS